MSGSKGGGPRPPHTHTDCADLAFRATLQSPDEQVVATLKKDDVLTIELRDLQGSPVIIASSPAGDAGSITSRMPDLLRCLQQGNEFVAVVSSIDDGLVVVLVRAK